MEHVYNGHDNRIDLLLKDDSSGAMIPTDLTPATKFELTIDSTTSFDSVANSAYFDTTDAADGKLYLILGDAGISAGIYCAEVTVYDTAYPDGIVWDEFDLTVHD